MPSTASSSLRLQKIATGEKLNTWGAELNTTVFELIEDAIAGWETHTVTGDFTLTATNYATDQARMAMINLTGSPSAAFEVTTSAVSKWYWIRNATGKTATITAGGVGVNVVDGEVAAVLCDGTDMYRANYADVSDYYLGPQASDPTTDLDGNALAEGDLYWNTVENEMRVYLGSSWQRIYPESLENLNNTEISQLENIDDTTISVEQWAYLGAATALGGAIMAGADAEAVRVLLGLEDIDGDRIRSELGWLKLQISGESGARADADANLEFRLSEAEDKLDGIEAGAQVNTVTSVAGRTGAVVITTADLDDLSTPTARGNDLLEATSEADVRELAGFGDLSPDQILAELGYQKSLIAGLWGRVVENEGA